MNPKPQPAAVKRTNVETIDFFAIISMPKNNSDDILVASDWHMSTAIHKKASREKKKKKNSDEWNESVRVQWCSKRVDISKSFTVHVVNVDTKRKSNFKAAVRKQDKSASVATDPSLHAGSSRRAVGWRGPLGRGASSSSSRTVERKRKTDRSKQNASRFGRSCARDDGPQIDPVRAIILPRLPYHGRNLSKSYSPTPRTSVTKQHNANIYRAVSPRPIYDNDARTTRDE